MAYVHHFISLPLDLHSELSEIARQRGISLSDILFESLLNAAEEHRPLLDTASLSFPFSGTPGFSALNVFGAC